MARIRELTDDERRLLEAVVRERMPPVALQAALEQVAAAGHGGATHAPHVCFDIDVPDDVALIPHSVRGPIDVGVRSEWYSELSLWIDRGRLSYLELSEAGGPVEDESLRWPDPAELEFESAKPGAGGRSIWKGIAGFAFVVVVIGLALTGLVVFFTWVLSARGL